MANTALKANRDGTPAWERAATRAAILSAARRLAERDGVPEISLTQVATEAGFAPASVYAYFSSKNDLLLAVVADDLAALARAMRRSAARDGSHEDTGAAAAFRSDLAITSNNPITLRRAFPALHLRAPPETEIAGQPETASVSAEVNGKRTEHQISSPDPHHRQIESRKSPIAGESSPADRNDDCPADPVRVPEENGDMPQTPIMDGGPERPVPWDADIIAKLQASIARLEARPVDAWLERRLRELERALAALNERQEQIGHGNAANQEEKIEDGLRILRLRLDAIDQRESNAGEEALRIVGPRIEAAEQRLRQLLSDAEGRSAEAERRLVSLENAAFATSPQLFPQVAAEAVQEQTPAESKPEEGEILGSALNAEDPVSEAAGGSAESYLAAARRLARSAALNQESPRSSAAVTTKFRRKAGTPHALYAAAGCLVLFSLLLGAGIFLRAREIEPVHQASAFVQSRPLYRTLAKSTVAKSAVAKPAAPQPNAQSHLLALAEAGNAKAELLVALEFLDSADSARNPALGMQWLTRAAAHGEPLAQYRLGKLYQDGVGVPADSAEAFRWYEAAALQGNRKAMHNVAVAYAEGWGTPKNLSEAARWFSRAAALGFLNSEFNLGVFSERGLGVPQSLPEAFKWYALAAAQGDKESQARVAALKTQLSADAIAAAQSAADAFALQPLDQAANSLPQLSDLPGR